MTHKHIYDSSGKQLCCTLEDNIYENAGRVDLKENHDHNDHDHTHHESGMFSIYLPGLVSLVLLLAGMHFDYWNTFSWFNGWIRLVWYIIAYIPVGFPVIKEAYIGITKGNIFSEFFLMTIATVGAFAIKEYPEGVAVMLFYAVGELLQTMAVRRAKSNIKTLLDQRPDVATVLRNSNTVSVDANDVGIGEVILLKPGEKLALDGILLSDNGTFNTAALTGESMPDAKVKGASVLAGMINLNTVVKIKVTAAYEDSKLSKMLELIQNASAQKAPTELFIRKFAKVYTPIVVGLAVAITLLPYFFAHEYIFRDWFYRALIFLVISCPCALVISIPLGYFGGIGAAGRNGILVKGSNYLDVLASVQHVVMDKTGTITEGVFKVQEALIFPEENRNKILQMVNALEKHSTHPVATAIHNYVSNTSTIELEKVEEISGHGMKAFVNGKELLVGNFKLLSLHNISFNVDPATIKHTVIAIAFDRKFAGYIIIADSIKTDAAAAIQKLKQMHVDVTMLSGDKTTVVNSVAEQTAISHAYGELLPEDKVEKVKSIINQKQTVAFVGDGVNDAPVIALSHVGIAMGGLGSDTTIETADVVIQDDNPIKIPLAINIGKQTKKVVWQNITMAFVIKAIVLILGSGGLATMWEAVFADVGVALLAIINAMRLLKMRFD
ncbi:MAG TPA: heavy metal translocating P-type ATPase [Bacteroidia bacterium]|nr:cadmium-translocating P-type ATPase [Bacteroidia bacterium]QQR95161.1 MAG: cadmium-translocating P-type ATPase [Bacteroidota bacterium]MBP7714232.1 cadmium-translocating P-type ATPase [Bacteroidia bacterium]MBP8669076.1 cadmium-translocating P-type ATPase [Bacteroidia bacterium]HOZ81643.1 heavy metal translocating P-type ATPase [Bacteroidia bacterium]